MEDFFRALAPSGGYAILLGLMLLGGFQIFRLWMADQGQRQSEREAQMRKDNCDQLEHERVTSANYHAMSDRMMQVIESNTSAITTLVETIRPMSDTLMRIDRHMGTDATARAPRKRTGETANDA
jgi:hypothetical protein